MARGRGRSAGGGRRFGRSGVWFVAVAAPLVVAGVLLGGREDAQAPDGERADCLPAGAHAVYLVDLRKPLPGAHATLPGRLLRDVAAGLPADAALEVYALAGYAEAPRMPLGRLCKPYGNDELAVSTAKDQGGAGRDCDDLPAQLPPDLRAAARAYCGQRDALAARLDALAAAPAGASVSGAYLVEALEDTGRDFAALDGPRSLYVLSDMMQHAAWFSHLDAPAEDWGAARFGAAVDGRDDAGPGFDAGVAVTVFYMARAGTTANANRMLAHQRFWAAHLAPAATVFENQAAVLEYVAEPLTVLPSEAERIGEERERLRYERAELDRLRAELEEGRRALAAERRELVSREDALKREQERLRARETALAAEAAARAGSGHGAGAGDS